jgi:hypothetical protein
MVLATQKTPYETKLAIILNLITCDPCKNQNIATCEIKKDLDKICYEPIGIGSNRCKYALMGKNNAKQCRNKSKKNIYRSCKEFGGRQ